VITGLNRGSVLLALFVTVKIKMPRSACTVGKWNVEAGKKARGSGEKTMFVAKMLKTLAKKIVSLHAVFRGSLCCCKLQGNIDPTDSSGFASTRRYTLMAQTPYQQWRFWSEGGKLPEMGWHGNTPEKMRDNCHGHAESLRTGQ
jgi:hypothetical protein